ncbi:DUF2089 family protein [Macrococcoides caseolyticum]|uniref:Uncharacterized protein n=2 Tax=Macrococcoides caseolyticum TaxID=69966 RepID=A0ACC9MP62_9STAP|nr:DUF2089 family protein [Macrococcus caseolyticus]MBQ5153690.1 DUF2089 family protein [Macrococcus caseolyticus]PKE11742.1 hypothetical protein CW685_06620 [Macrococcus caseolyticus]PKE16515.1 hypothetical protein CW718_09195 [Macrococcus caseolyticus]PKE20755.1 hypothetical protein CW688_10905 [Macrococcus caseolyticus]PKE26823.1 hypothetical protein CW686_02585 [Macrococcus caseolyticus]
MDKNEIPEWVLKLDKEDIEFMRNFTIESGSLKNIAKLYDVSYPTVRIRLNNLIQKIELATKEEQSSLISYVKSLAIDEKISLEDAKKIISIYNNEKE